jgi:uncharacterized membrane protein
VNGILAALAKFWQIFPRLLGAVLVRKRFDMAKPACVSAELYIFGGWNSCAAAAPASHPAMVWPMAHWCPACCVATLRLRCNGALASMDKHIQPVSRLRNWSAIIFIVVANSFGNLLLAMGTKDLPDFRFSGVPLYLVALLSSPEIVGGTALLALWMFAQLSMLSWSDLSYVLPVTASGYIITAVLGISFLGESVSKIHWAGIALISAGVLVVAETPPKTVHERNGRRV